MLGSLADGPCLAVEERTQFRLCVINAGVEHVWNVMAHAQKPDLVFQRNGRVHLNWRRSVQSTTGSRGVRISGSNDSNAGYTMFWGRVQDYWLPTPLVCSPFTSPTVRHRVPLGFNWALVQNSLFTRFNCPGSRAPIVYVTLYVQCWLMAVNSECQSITIKPRNRWSCSSIWRPRYRGTQIFNKKQTCVVNTTQ